MQRRGDRGVRPDSLTNQLRALAKHRPRKRPQLDPLPPQSSPRTANSNSRDDEAESMLMDTASLLEQTQSPLRLQWLVDDFVNAAGSGNLKKVDRYIRGGVPVDRNHSVLHYSALHAAAALNKDGVTKVLVQAGADVNAKTQDCESALHMAARYGRPEVVQEILRHSAEMTSPNHMGFTPMEIAVDRQDHELERLLEPPPDTPTDVHTQVVSSTSLTVAWRSNCSVASAYLFKITWSLCESAGESSEECATTFFRISNLLPASRYSVSVQAGNHTVGWSARSPTAEFETDGDVPSAMVAPTIVEVSDSFIRMRLQLPQCNGSDVTRLSVQSQCTGAIAAVTTSSFRRLLKPQDHEHAWESIMSDVSQLRSCDAAIAGDKATTDMSATCQTQQQPAMTVANDANDMLGSNYKEFVATGLAPGRVYYFRAKAMNQSGWSPDGEVSDGVCTNDCPKIVRATARSMQLVWTKPYSTEHVDGYELQARVSTATRWDVLATHITSQSLDVSGLVPATAYSFRVVPHYVLSGWGDAQKVACSPLVSTESAPPEPPVDFRVLDRTVHSITVSWRIPRCNGHIVESYALQHRQVSDSSWTEVNSAIPVDCEKVVVERLQRGSAHCFRVRARNALGDGAFLVHDDVVWTYPFVAPTAPICVARTSFSLHITWHDGHSSDDADCEAALVFDVHMRQVEGLAAATDDDATQQHVNGTGDDDLVDRTWASMRGSWSVVAQGLCDHAAVVSGLSPLSCYIFRVRAHNDTGRVPIHTCSNVRAPPSSQQLASVLSPVSDVFQTLRRI